MMTPTIATRMKKANFLLRLFIKPKHSRLLETVTPTATETKIVQQIRATARDRDDVIHNTELSGNSFAGAAVLTTLLRAISDKASHSQ